MRKITSNLCFSSILKCKFTMSIGVQKIRNFNLTFDSNHYKIFLFPIYPQVYKLKDKQTFGIPSSSSLSLVFVDKTLEYTEAWEKRRTIVLKFKQLGEILSAETNSGKRVVIQTNSKDLDRTKTLTITDLKETGQMQISLVSQNKQRGQSDLQKISSSLLTQSIEAKMPYKQYNLMYKLIENSLLDLSGWRLMMQIQKKEQIQKIDSKIVDQKQLSELLKN